MVKKGINRVEFTVEELFRSSFKIYFSGFCYSKNNLIYKSFTIYQHIYYFYILLFLRPNYLFYLAMNDDFIWSLKLSKILNIKIILDIYTLREDILLKSPKIGSKKFSTKRINKIIESDKYKVYNSKYLIHLSQNDINFVKLRYPNYSGHDFILPLSIPYQSTKISTPIKREIINIVWWGQLSEIHGIEYVLSEFKKLNKKLYNLHIFDTSKARVEKYKNKYRNKNIYFYHNLNFKNGLKDWIFENGSIILGLFGKSEIAGIVLPNKVVEGLQFNLPIITIKSNCYTEFNMDDAVLQSDRSPGNLSTLIKKYDFNRTIDNTILSEYFSVQSFNKRFKLILNEISGS